MPVELVERRHPLVRIRAGDYLMLSNDATTVWRLVSYVEDGSAEVSSDGKRWRTLRGDYWALWRWKTPVVDNDDLDNLDPDDWDTWEFWSNVHPTRREAIDEALKADARVVARARR